MALLLTICGYAITVLELLIRSLANPDAPIPATGALINLFDGMIHWIITQTYLKTAYETK